MKKGSINFAICMYLIILSCHRSEEVDKHSLLKEYALCKFISYALPNDTVLQKDPSISVYRELIRYNFDKYDKIDSLAKKAFLNITPSKLADHEGRKLILYHSLEFYKSKTLDSLITIIQ